MHTENEIQLSGPFTVTDSSGNSREIKALRIFDESYGIIDIYADLAVSSEDEALHEDATVIRQIVAKLRTLGYAGPDFGVGDPGLQDDKLIVLEAPEEFGEFATTKGWKNLAEEYLQDEVADDSNDIPNGSTSTALFDALMRKFQVK